MKWNLDLFVFELGWFHLDWGLGFICFFVFVFLVLRFCIAIENVTSIGEKLFLFTVCVL